jgi:NADP-dependent 3-hydroxy acid dehydrogenase YdfG
MNGIKGKVVVITGASSGLGEATARHLASLGAKLIIGARRIDRLQAIAKEIEAAGGEARAVEVDVTRKEAVDRLRGAYRLRKNRCHGKQCGAHGDSAAVTGPDRRVGPDD